MKEWKELLGNQIEINQSEAVNAATTSPPILQPILFSRSLSLSFDIWSQTPKPQEICIDHCSTGFVPYILHLVSTYKRFNGHK